MSKFPDPTKDYGAQPVSGAIDLSANPATPAPSPSVPVYTAPAPEPEPASPPPSGAEASAKVPPAPSAIPGVTGSPFRNLIPLVIGLAGVLLLAFLGFTVLPKLFNKSSGPVTLNYWGLWEPTSVMQAVIADYEAAHPNIKINYTMESPKNYRTRFLAAGTAANSPDIVRIHNTWLPQLRKSLSPAPDTTLKVGDLSDYYPVMQKNFVVGGKIYALPLEVDGLALFYNEDIFKEAGATPPADWNSLRKLAFDLTKTNPETKIISRAGVALGTTSNIDNWSDILGLLIMQNSGTPGKPTDQAVQDALTFYTIFSTQDKSWDSSQPNSTYAFATGTVAMIIAPAWEVAEIKAINPDLHFKVAPAPTLPSSNISWATYWAEAVPLTSKHPAEAWNFIKYLSTPAVLQKMYAGESQIRPIGEPYPLKSLASSLANDPLAGPFVSQGANYSSWYMAGRTYDAGINDENIKYYEDAVNGINSGTSVPTVIKSLDAGIQQVLAKYPEAQ